MCGIFGFLNFNISASQFEIVKKLLQGLYSLEYRGYDSAGIAFDVMKGDEREVVVLKKEGAVAELEKMYNEIYGTEPGPIFDYHCGIAHTRWATHGEVTASNSHPHTSSPQNEFVIVHNGIITNYLDLKKMLIARDFEFITDTDTEVFAKLLLFCYRQLMKDRREYEKVPFVEVVKQAVSYLHGSYAILVKSKYYPKEMVAIRKGSPLILGSSHAESDAGDEADVFRVARLSLTSTPSIPEVASEFYFASDASAIMKHTKRVMYLQDFDLVHIKNGSVSIFNIASFLQKKISSQLPQTREFITIDEEIETIMRGSYDSFMQKEIFEQPESLKTTMRGRVRYKEHTVRLGGIVDHERDVESSRRVVMLACGTSYHAALATQQVLEELTGLPVFVDLASEFVDRSPNVYRDDLFVFISQSGETIDTLKAVKYVKKRGALVCGITNTVGSAIARETHFGIHVNAGVEIGVASTKAYTCQIICVVMFALVMSADSLKRAERRIEIIDGLRDLPSLLTETLECEPQIEKLSKELVGCKSILVIGRGYHFSTALEGALKIKEISYVHSEGISASELKHGPIALVDESIPVILVCTQDSLYKEVFSALEQLSARHGTIICICNKGDEDVRKKATVVIEIPKTVDCLQCVLNVIPLQLMSYHLAKALGRNVDRPRNLAKSVVV